MGTRRKKQHIDEKQKKKQTTSGAEERHRFYPSPPQHGAVMKEKSKQTLGLVASSFPFLFLCPDSLFTFPRTTTKNIGNSVDPRGGTRLTLSPLKMISILVERVYRLLYLIFVIYLSPEIVMPTYLTAEPRRVCYCYYLKASRHSVSPPLSH